MIALHRAMSLTAALALVLLQIPALAQELPPSTNPWKAAYARRLAREGLERKEESERRRARALLEWRQAKRARSPRPGDRARPAAPEPGPVIGTQAAPSRDRTRAFAPAELAAPTNTIVNSRAGDGPGSGQSETSIAAFGDVVVAAWNDGQGFTTNGDTQGWATSADGGLTWVDRGDFPHPVGLSRFLWISDPVLAVNEKTGAFYFSALCEFGNPGSERAGVGVIKGHWNGTTIAWGNPVIAKDSPFAGFDFVDKSWVVADSASGRVYLSYTQFRFGVSSIVFQRSDSNAVAWSTPMQISRNDLVENGFVQGSRPAVDGNGRVYVVYELIGQGFSDFYKIARSDDQGLSFAVPVVAESIYTNFGTGPPGFNRPSGVDFCGIAVDRSHGPNRGRIYLSWAESINWLDEVFDLGRQGDNSEVESNNSPASATPITLGQTLRGRVTSSTDADYYGVALTQGQHIVIAADSAQTSPPDAMSLRLIAGDGVTRLTYTTFDSSVNPSPGQPSGFPIGWLFTAPVAGTYYIRVAAFTSTGSYRLRTGAVHRDLERGRDQRDVFVGHSDDGTSWSVPVRLSEDAPGFDSFTPEVAVAANGGVYCSWYDYRNAASAKDGGEASVFLAQSIDGGGTWATTGALSDSLSDWTAALTNIQPNQGDYMTLFASSSYVWSIWSDARRGDPDAFSTRIPVIQPVTLVLPVSFKVEPTTLNLSAKGRWVTGSIGVSPQGAQEIDLASIRLNGVVPVDAQAPVTIRPGASEVVVRFDRDAVAATVSAGERVPMKVTGSIAGGPFAGSDTVRVFWPGGRAPVSEQFQSTAGWAQGGFAVRVPSAVRVDGAGLRVWLALDGEGPAQLVLVDVAGRVLASELVEPLATGPREVRLATPSALGPGIYFIRLRRGSREAAARAAIVR